jgi:serine/threonine protein kinase
VSPILADDFPRSDRFELRGLLGAGGFGTVYQAFDRQGGALVALKVLRRPDAPALYRFKQEFRALADVAHPNLVTLYELMTEEGRWFFTMELLDGVDFLDHVWELAPLERAALGTDTATPTSPLLDGATTLDGCRARHDPAARRPAAQAPRAAHPAGRPRVSYDRLRASLAQLAEGVVALHAAGKLHRDIKPSNVLVTREGRVVLLDFGLVSEQADERQTLTGHVVGSAPYMSPEQGSGLPLSEASDWYSVGTVLYEALTGTLPFEGPLARVLTEKLQFDAPPPRALAPWTPEDLDALCRALLRREPRERLGGRELLERLGGARAAAALAASAVATAPFVGRQLPLAVLDEALATARKGRTCVVSLHGRSGIGKTGLVRRFLDEVRRRDPHAVVLAGRCYERESVPYKAFDSLVDALSQHLRGLPDAQAEALLPADVLALARLFPVLRQVDAVAGARRRVLEIPDSHELRRRAFAALRELLRRLARRAPLVLAIDDLQWGDLDSAALLAELLAPPDPPPFLLVGSHRSEEAGTSGLLRLFGTLRGAASAAVDWRELALGELTRDEARQLAGRLLGGGASLASLAEEIAAESGGSPLLIAELVRYSQAGGGLAPRTRLAAGAPADQQPPLVTLERMLQLRVERLPGPSRRLLEVLAVAGQPLELDVARGAADVPSEQAALAPLRSGHLVRTRGADDRQLEVYHDRIREIVVAQLDAAALRAHHLQLARALEAGGRADPETLATHFQEGGQLARAAEYAATAAAQAARALAFDRAARLYRLALELRRDESPEALELRVGLGDALANAGRGAEAAGAYQAAAARAAARERLELLRRAADQLLRSGHLDQGLAALREVLGALGMRLAGSPRRALLSLLLRRALIRLRGLRYRERDASAVPPHELMRIDTCWSAAVGLSLVDNIRGADFQGRHLLLALKAGEPYRISRALALEGAHRAAGGSRARERTQELVRRATLLAERIQHPHALGLAALMAGATAILEGRWLDAHRATLRAEQILRDRCTGVAWELDTTRNYILLALLSMGEWGELGRLLPALLQDAHERGDLFAAIRLRARMSPAVRLAADDAAGARAEVQEALRAWSSGGFHIQHFHALWGELSALLYAGEAEAAWALLERSWPALAGSVLLRIQFVRIDMQGLRARAALSLARASRATGSRDLAPLLRQAGRAARALERERSPWGQPCAVLVRAGLASLASRRQDAVSLLIEAENGFDDAHMGLHASAARRRRGELLGGHAGRELIEAADAWMLERQIRNPVRMADLLAPIAAS